MDGRETYSQEEPNSRDRTGARVGYLLAGEMLVVVGAGKASRLDVMTLAGSLFLVMPKSSPGYQIGRPSTVGSRTGQSVRQ